MSCTMFNANNETSKHLTSQGWTEQNYINILGTARSGQCGNASPQL